MQKSLQFVQISSPLTVGYPRSRQELSNEYLLAKIGVDTAENEPLKVHLIFKLWNLMFTEPPRPIIRDNDESVRTSATWRMKSNFSCACIREQKFQWTSSTDAHETLSKVTSTFANGSGYGGKIPSSSDVASDGARSTCAGR